MGVNPGRVLSSLTTTSPSSVTKVSTRARPVQSKRRNTSAASCLTRSVASAPRSAGQLTSVSQSSGGTDTNLTAISAAVIGGTSLFGGRGNAYSALLGILVLQSIQSGLNVVGVDSSVRYMVTGGVLVLAVAIDSVSRRARSSSGRG